MGGRPEVKLGLIDDVENYSVSMVQDRVKRADRLLDRVNTHKLPKPPTPSSVKEPQIS